MITIKVGRKTRSNLKRCQEGGGGCCWTANASLWMRWYCASSSRVASIRRRRSSTYSHKCACAWSNTPKSMLSRHPSIGHYPGVDAEFMEGEYTQRKEFGRTIGISFVSRQNCRVHLFQLLQRSPLLLSKIVLGELRPPQHTRPCYSSASISVGFNF